MINYQQDIYLLILLIINVSVLILFIFFNNRISNSLKLIDKVNNKNKVILHKIDTPNNGGLILLLFITSFYLFSFYANFIENFKIIYLFFILYFVIGLLDDYLNINPTIKIVLYIFITYLILANYTPLIINNFYIETFNAVFYLEDYSIPMIPFTILCIFFMLNILNMSDGINGSLITFSLPVFIIIFFNTFNIFFLFIILSLIFLLYLNLTGKLFLGNNGASLIGSLISFILILEAKNDIYLLSAEKILIIFSIPTFDLLRLFYNRLSNKKNPFLGDLNHFHHLVLKNYSSYIWIPLIISYTIISYFLSFYLYSILIIFITLCIYVITLKYSKKNL